jgi:serine/threonine-protein kinase
MGLLDTFRVKKLIDTLLTAPDPTGPEVTQAIGRLKQFGAAAVPKLIEALGNTPTPEPVVQLLAALLHNNTLPLFCAGLAQADSRIVTAVVAILSRHATYDPNRLLELFTDPKMPKAALVQVLAAHKEALQPKALLELLQTMDKDNRTVILRLLEQVTTEALLPGLIPLTKSDDWLVRQQIARSLGRFSTYVARETLQHLLQDPHKGVRMVALEALVSCKRPLGIDPLCQLLRDPDLTIQSKAMEALVRLNDPQAIPYLLEVLQDDSEYMRRAAVEVLNAIGNTDAIRDLLGALRDKDWWVRVRAADALGSIGGPKVVEAVLALIKDQDEFIRRCAIEILNIIKDPRAFDHLLGALDDPDWWVRERAVDALAQLGDRRAVPALLRLLEPETEATPAAIRALEAFGDQGAIRPLLTKLLSPNKAVQKEALRALATLTDATHAALVQQGIAAAMAAADREIKEQAAKVYRALVAKFDTPGAAATRPAEGATSLLVNQPALSQTRHPVKQTDSLMVASAAVDMPMASSAAQPPANREPITAGQLLPGIVLAERYRVISQIGKGGFGTVVLVEDLVVHEEIVLKFLHPHLAADEQVIKRFIHELRFTRKITHEHVIRIYDFLTLGSSVAISMEYFPSHTLASEIKRDVPMTQAYGLKIIRDICSGMSVAHQANIVHRDLKPQNVLINDHGLVKIVDFGLAAAMSHTDAHLTASGVLMGTPMYMAPEQIQGGEVDARTDIYSLGIIMYEMFTGRPPYLGKDLMAIMYQHLQGKATAPRALNAALSPLLERLICTAMAVDPAHRYQNIDALRLEIAACEREEAA